MAQGKYIHIDKDIDIDLRHGNDDDDDDIHTVVSGYWRFCGPGFMLKLPRLRNVVLDHFLKFPAIFAKLRTSLSFFLLIFS